MIIDQFSFDQRIIHLEKCLGGLEDYPSHSRIHPLKPFGDEQKPCFVKREDELGFGISGFKIRKYLSLIPHLIKNNIEEAVLIGGAYSNNIVGLTQLLIEKGIKPTLFLRGDEKTRKIGNFLLSSMMVPCHSIHWISRSDWDQVDTKAACYAADQTRRTMLIAEGARVPAALPGSLTLALDILKNEDQTQTHFDHVFIDSGTGLMACATLLAFAWLGKPTIVHVVLMAEGEAHFLKTLTMIKEYVESLIYCPIAWDKINERVRLYFPEKGRSVGSTHKEIFNEIHTIAQTEGFLTDPIYSAKLFLEARRLIHRQAIKGNCLLIHSGGGLTLMGFQEQLFLSSPGLTR